MVLFLVGALVDLVDRLFLQDGAGLFVGGRGEVGADVGLRLGLQALDTSMME